jgi:anaerobic ribonucleoside-triphosphate reductase
MSFVNKSICVCVTCGRTVDSNFIYCPWCGQSRLEEHDNDSSDIFINYLIELQNEKRNRQLDNMETKLDRLDMELSSLALSVEMHK